MLLVALAALGAATLFVSARLAGIDVAGCGTADCTALLDQRGRLERLSLPLQELSAVLPIFAGLLVGVAIVGREIERNTAVLAWSMGLSRLRWLSARVLVVGAVIVLGSAIPAIATEALSAAAHPGVDLARSFANLGGRGSVVIERALIALAVGVLAGTILGRPLPALLAAGVAVVALLVVLELGQERVVAGRGRPPGRSGPGRRPGGRWNHRDALPDAERVAADVLGGQSRPRRVGRTAGRRLRPRPDRHSGQPLSRGDGSACGGERAGRDRAPRAVGGGRRPSPAVLTLHET